MAKCQLPESAAVAELEKSQSPRYGSAPHLGRSQPSVSAGKTLPKPPALQIQTLENSFSLDSPPTRFGVNTTEVGKENLAKYSQRVNNYFDPWVLIYFAIGEILVKRIRTFRGGFRPRPEELFPRAESEITYLIETRYSQIPSQPHLPSSRHSTLVLPVSKRAQRKKLRPRPM